MLMTLYTPAQLSSNKTRDNIHHYIFTAKIQTHKDDTPTYKEILKCLDEEKKLWVVVMSKELETLRDLR